MVMRLHVWIVVFQFLLFAWQRADAENFLSIDVGIVYSDVSPSEPSPVDGDFSSAEFGYHFAFGAYRNKNESPWIYGVKFEAQDVVGNSLIGIRAIDIGYRFTPRITVNGFLGASRYDLTTATFGYRLGIGGRFRFLDNWSAGIEAVFNDKLARDKVLPEEDLGVGSPDIFYDIVQLSIFVNYRF